MSAKLFPRSVAPDRRRRDRFLARVLAWSLDHELAAGCPPEFSPAMASRAGQIVSPSGRQRLTENWDQVLDRAGRPAGIRTAPLCRNRIAAAEPDVRGMLAVLRGRIPITGRGAAMASLKLTDGTGPLYSRRCLLDLGGTVREATTHMNPFAALPD